MFKGTMDSALFWSIRVVMHHGQESFWSKFGRGRGVPGGRLVLLAQSVHDITQCPYVAPPLPLPPLLLLLGYENEPGLVNLKANAAIPASTQRMRITSAAEVQVALFFGGFGTNTCTG